MKNKLITAIKSKAANLIASLKNLFSFVALVVMYSFLWLMIKVSRGNKRWAKKIMKLDSWVKRMDKKSSGGVSKLYLIEIAFKNMGAKRTRTVITIGGMAIGISFIVFLVSVGYGMEQLVISRVARLDELKQAEVLPGLSRDLRLDDATLAKLTGIPNVVEVLPLISVVGRVSYAKSVSDIAVYGATTDYLKYSALQPVKGTLFQSNKISQVDKPEGQVAGAQVSVANIGDEIGEVSYLINPDEWLKVRSTPGTRGKILGFTRRAEGQSSGTETWGGTYLGDEAGQAGEDSDGNKLGKWVKAKFPIWDKESCSTDNNPDCVDGEYLVKREESAQVQAEGYVAELSMTVTGNGQPQVLGETTDVPLGTLPVVEDASESAAAASQKIEKTEVKSSEEKSIVVNRSVLQILNIPESEAIGKEVTVSMVVSGDLLDDANTRIESTPGSYKIIGVIPDEETPMIYIPFMDVRSMGVNRFSQVKVIVKDKNSLSSVRTTIESAGYGTVSVADTVEQIDNLFTNFRLILSVLGLVALAVASLGMFNTLTVSLLERTREVGLMKAMGMKSEEIKSLFLTESMIMGFYGGIIGLIIGTLAGKVLSILLSVFSIVKGVGFVDVSYVPPTYVLAVLMLSMLVALVTGYYPAKRATKISALNALRYE